jgi:hypothetical protein
MYINVLLVKKKKKKKKLYNRFNLPTPSLGRCHLTHHGLLHGVLAYRRLYSDLRNASSWSEAWHTNVAGERNSPPKTIVFHLIHICLATPATSCISSSFNLSANFSKMPEKLSSSLEHFWIDQQHSDQTSFADSQL